MAPRQRATKPEPEEIPFELTEEDKLNLINQHLAKPSSLPTSTNSPLLFLNPEELTKLSAKRDEEEDEEEEELALWEELANAVLTTIPFGFLFAGLDYAVHAQYGQKLFLKDELSRILNVIPGLLFLTFILSRPTASLPLRPLFIQILLFIVCVVSGIALIEITRESSYLLVMKQSPAIGVIWIWSVVRMDLNWAVGGLAGVGIGLLARSWL